MFLWYWTLSHAGHRLWRDPWIHRIVMNENHHLLPQFFLWFLSIQF
jgi:hypothetical protein